jgi:hypothetical protein
MRLSLLSLLFAITLAGCQSVPGQLRARTAANESWRQSESLYATVPHVGTFADGYKSGFNHVMTGGDPNRQPAPPGRLRNEDHSKAAVLLQAWHDGYSHGVLAAMGPEATQHATLDTRTMHQGAPGNVTETIISEERMESSTVTFAVTTTDLPPSAPQAPASEVIIESPNPITPTSPTSAPVEKAITEPKFVPPPPAPPVEKSQVTMMSGERAAKSEAPRGITKPQSPETPLPSTAQPVTPMVKDAPNVPKRSEWEMPVFHSKAVFAR